MSNVDVAKAQLRLAEFEQRLIDGVRVGTKPRGFDDRCWHWTGPRLGGGRLPSVMGPAGRYVTVRRVLFERNVHELTDKQRLPSVACGNDDCVNPDHLAPFGGEGAITISTHVSVGLVSALDALVDQGVYESRSSALRTALEAEIKCRSARAKKLPSK